MAFCKVERSELTVVTEYWINDCHRIVQSEFWNSDDMLTEDFLEMPSGKWLVVDDMDMVLVQCGDAAYIWDSAPENGKGDLVFWDTVDEALDAFNDSIDKGAT